MLACSVVTFLTIMLVCICLFSLNYYMDHEEAFGFSKVWLQIAIIIVLALVVSRNYLH